MTISEGNNPPKTPREKELHELNKLPLEENALPGEYGVLLSDQIHKCVKEFHLISPFDPQQLKPASYRLTVGDRYALGGKPCTLEEHGEIRIEPFQVAVIQTRERLNLSRNMIARWNIKVSRAYEGLIWAGGPQVDPGYKGHLFCPIYNLSNQDVTLHYGDQIAVIDFIKTTAFDGDICKEFPRPPDAVVLEDYAIGMQSALHAYASERMKEMQEKLAGFQSAFNVFVGITFAVMGVLVAALSIKPDKAVSSSLPIIISLAALTLSFVSILRPAQSGWWRIVLTVFSSAVFGGFCYWLILNVHIWWPAG